MCGSNKKTIHDMQYCSRLDHCLEPLDRLIRTNPGPSRNACPAQVSQRRRDLVGPDHARCMGGFVPPQPSSYCVIQQFFRCRAGVRLHREERGDEFVIMYNAAINRFLPFPPSHGFACGTRISTRTQICCLCLDPGRICYFSSSLLIETWLLQYNPYIVLPTIHRCL